MCADAVAGQAGPLHEQMLGDQLALAVREKLCKRGRSEEQAHRQGTPRD